MDNPVELFKYSKDAAGQAQFLSELKNRFVANQQYVDYEVFADQDNFYIVSHKRDTPKYPCQCACTGGACGGCGIKSVQ